jgi:hypothetical protein
MRMREVPLLYRGFKMVCMRGFEEVGTEVLENEE